MTTARRIPAWALAVVPLLLIAGALALLLTVGGDTLGERPGPPVEEVAVERTVLRPGEIELTVRNTGPDAVTVAQAFINDAYVDFSSTSDRIGARDTERFTFDYPWTDGSPYRVSLVTETGVVAEHAIDVAVETPETDGSFYGLMALLGLYVGVIPVALGMLFLPFLRTVREHWIRFLMAVTIGLLAVLAIDAWLEGTEIAEGSSGAFGGAQLLFLGAGTAYLALVALDRWLSGRRATARAAGASGGQLSLLIAVGIGLHNLGEGLAIGSAYAVGELALGAFLVFGFALHNTTEGLAIVAPLNASRPTLGRLALLGFLAGAPAILGAVIGAAAFNAELATLMLGFGIGAIVQVIVQLVPTIKDGAGRALHPLSVAGIVVGGLVLYSTSLIITV